MGENWCLLMVTKVTQIRYFANMMKNSPFCILVVIFMYLLSTFNISEFKLIIIIIMHFFIGVDGLSRILPSR